MITALIVDDEPYCCETLALLLERYCPDVHIIDVCYSAETAYQSIRERVPTLLFLDIEMPRSNGFELLERLTDLNFELIFTTSYDQYAIKAIRFSALDYLLKPIDPEELQKAVEKVIQKPKANTTAQIELLLEQLLHPIKARKIAIPTMEGLQMIEVQSIISCSSDSNYSVLLLKNKKKLVVSRTLKEIEGLLNEHPFLRVHHSFLVNLDEVQKYIKGKGGYLVMSDDSIVDVSSSRKEALLKKLQPNKF
jgi:two-component system LytT family response regulator